MGTLGSQFFQVLLARAPCSNTGFAEESVRCMTFMAAKTKRTTSLVGLIMGSRSDWETLQHSAATLEALGIAFESQVVSAHRTPDLLFEYASGAAARGIEVIIAGAGGAAHLPGMCAAKTALPVLGVPVQSKTLSGLDSLLSIVQMPAGVPVGTVAIGKAGAINAALLAAAILGIKHRRIRTRYEAYRREQTASVMAHLNPAEASESKQTPC